MDEIRLDSGKLLLADPADATDFDVARPAPSDSVEEEPGAGIDGPAVSSGLGAGYYPAASVSIATHVFKIASCSLGYPWYIGPVR